MAARVGAKLRSSSRRAVASFWNGLEWLWRDLPGEPCAGGVGAAEWTPKEAQLVADLLTPVLAGLLPAGR
jgi:hypothetical protein